MSGSVRAVGFAAIVAVLVASVSPRPALAAPAGDYSAMDAYVRTAMEESAVPGMSYALVRDGAVLHTAAFGVADPSGRSMTPQTPVVIGSTGKTLTALAIRQLVAAGRIDEEALIRRYLPWFSLATPGAADSITVTTLLEHTSGLAKADGQNPAYYEPGLTSEQVVRLLASVHTDRAAGTYEYSNLNYVILGTIVEAVSGQSYGEYLRDHVFGPLGMTHSYASIDDARGGGLAQGHRYLFGLPVPFDEPYPTAIVPAGYQISSAEDMGRYLAALSNHGRYGDADIAGGGVGETDYGIDWRPLSGAMPGYTPGHSGTTLNTNTAIIYTPGAHVGVVVLANANPTQLMNMPLGASDIALGVLRLDSGGTPDSAPPTVRTVYLLVDAILLLLAGLVVVESIRLRGWRRRIAVARRRRLHLGRTLGVNAALPLAILMGLPLWIGSSGSVPAIDPVAAWRFMAWTLPDLAIALFGVAVALLSIGIVKVALLRRQGQAASARASVS